jgi:hypothetical protein
MGEEGNPFSPFPSTRNPVGSGVDPVGEFWRTVPTVLGVDHAFNNARQALLTETIPFLASRGLFFIILEPINPLNPQIIT